MPFSDFIGNEAAKARVGHWLDQNCLPHALLIAAVPGCGKNEFARLVAAAYLNDQNSLALRGAHPDCLVVEGEGASGNIPVKRIRELAYELNMAAVMANGRRVALLKDVRNLNKNSANALLKILEEPPSGVVFILTASYVSDILETIRSRCVTVPLLPLTPAQCAEAATQLYPDYDQSRIHQLSTLYDGRLGLVKKALAAPERLALTDAALRFCDAAVAGDKLKALVELEGAANRDELKVLLDDAAFCLRHRLNNDPVQAQSIRRVSDSVTDALAAIGHYASPKLVAAQIATQI